MSLAPKPPFPFALWTAGPFLVIFIVAMPFLVPEYTLGRAILVVALCALCGFALLGLYSAAFGWAWRGVGAILFLGYLAYVISMFIEDPASIAPTASRSEPSLLNALMGLVIFGGLGLRLALHGPLFTRLLAGVPWLRLVAVALLGSVTTVAVAWGLAVRTPAVGGGVAATFGSDVRYLDAPAQNLTWMLTEKHRPGVSERLAIAFWTPRSGQAPIQIDPNRMLTHGDLPAWSIVRSEVTDPVRRSANVYLEALYGWPIPAMWMRHEQTGSSVTQAIPLPRRLRFLGPGRSLPGGPVAGALLVDTGVYAAAWYALLFGYGTCRAWRRRCRGLCSACGYDLHGIGDGRCPECGRVPDPAEAP